MIIIILLYIFIIITSCTPSQQQLSESEAAEQLYKKLFKRQRAEQLEAIKNFQKLSNYEKQYSMIMLMAEKMFTVIQDSRATIEASPYIPGVSDFPLDIKIREALSNILENTALFSEVVLRFPDVAVSIIKNNSHWDLILQWGIAFCNQVKYLLDNNTLKLFHLVSQELDHIEREPNYINPYRKVKNREVIESENQKPKKKKKKLVKGPKLTGHFEL